MIHRTLFLNTRNLDEHVKLIEGQARKSRRDSETRQLSAKIVNGRYDDVRDPRTGRSRQVVRGWDMDLLAPPGPDCAPRDDRCEIVKYWDFMVLNFRYVFDPDNVDTFATLRASLEAGGGDCDDANIAFDALMSSTGWKMAARVISTTDNPDEWVHIYPLVGFPKDSPTCWVPLDITVQGAVPGWEYPDIANKRDYLLDSAPRARDAA